MATEITIEVPELEDLGPAMRSCTEKERRFVVAFFATGKREMSAHAAGYKGEIGSNVLGVQAYHVWHRPRVQEAIREFAGKSVLAGLVPLAFKAVEELLLSGDDKSKARAAQLVLDRTGFHAQQEIKVVKVDETRDERIKRIVRLCQERGIDPRTLIGGAVDFVDAEFTALPAPAESSTDGIEDLL